MSTVPLTACIITLNEEDNIERCIKSVQWVDEILVVDSGSDDRTCEIAENLGAKVLYNEWPGHKEQKQFATDQASNNWILSLDADEAASEELQNAVRTAFLDGLPSPETCFQVNRLTHYLGDWIRHGSWHPDWIVRLFNRTETEWGGTNPHDKVIPTRNVEYLDGVLYHYPYDDLADHLKFINYYTDIMSHEKDQAGVEGSIFKAITHGAFKTFKDLVIKRGVLDGKRGIACAIVGGFYTFMKYLKLWERQNLDVPERSDYPTKD